MFLGLTPTVEYTKPEVKHFEGYQIHERLVIVYFMYNLPGYLFVRLAIASPLAA
jgi:hypothetical protein